MRYNIVLFGESGVGKSSVINMIIGQEKAATASTATGCTLKAVPYACTVSGHDFTLWDTAGLNEGEQGKVDDVKAVANLYRLLKGLESGVSLLVFCMRAPRINDAAHKNWKLFREIICQKHVPIVVAVTHLEKEEPMDAWWTTNERDFRNYEMNPSNLHGTGVACIAASKGKLKKDKYVFQEEYDESQIKIRKLLIDNHLRAPWKVSPVQWFHNIVTYSTDTDCWGNVKHIKHEHTVSGRGIHELAARWGVSEEEATKLAKILES